jgi:uncharacterized membrane protein
MTDIDQPLVDGAIRGGAPVYRDLAFILFGAVILSLAIFVGEYLALPPALAWPLNLARLALGLVYVLYVPGYCLSTALFPRHDDLDSIERAGLSLGLSIAWIPVVALVLNWLPWGLSLEAILIGQLVSIVALAAATVGRRERLPYGEAYSPEVAWRPGSWWRSVPSPHKRLYLLCAGAVLVAGLAVASVFLIPSPDEFITEFYILGQDGLAENYPRRAVVGETLSVTMGITNHEREAMTYRVEVWAADPRTGQRISVNEAGPLALSSGETIMREITWQMPQAGQDMTVEFYLFAEGREAGQPYRSLQLWLDVD